MPSTTNDLLNAAREAMVGIDPPAGMLLDITVRSGEVVLRLYRAKETPMEAIRYALHEERSVDLPDNWYATSAASIPRPSRQAVQAVTAAMRHQIDNPNWDDYRRMASVMLRYSLPQGAKVTFDIQDVPVEITEDIVGDLQEQDIMMLNNALREAVSKYGILDSINLKDDGTCLVELRVSTPVLPAMQPLTEVQLASLRERLMRWSRRYGLPFVEEEVLREMVKDRTIEYRLVQIVLDTAADDVAQILVEHDVRRGTVSVGKITFHSLLNSSIPVGVADLSSYRRSS